MNKILITIKRANGVVEEVESKTGAMNASLFAKFQQHNRAAGRGELLSWREVSVDERSEAEKAYATVERAIGASERAENAAYYSPEQIVLARIAAEKALSDWAAKYPIEAAAKTAKQASDKAIADAKSEVSVAEFLKND